MTRLAKHQWISIDCLTYELRSDKNSYRRPCSIDGRVGDAPANVCLCLQHACTNTPKRREQNRNELYAVVYVKPTQLIIKDRSAFCIEAIQTQSVARPLCDSIASCWRWKKSVYTSTLTSPEVTRREDRHECLYSQYWTKSSAVAERPRSTSCLSIVSFNIPTAQFFITSYCGFRFTTA